MEYTPKTPATAEAFDYGYFQGMWDALQELADFMPEVKETGLWKEYVSRGED